MLFKRLILFWDILPVYTIFFSSTVYSWLLSHMHWNLQSLVNSFYMQSIVFLFLDNIINEEDYIYLISKAHNLFNSLITIKLTSYPLQILLLKLLSAYLCAFYSREYQYLDIKKVAMLYLDASFRTWLYFLSCQVCHWQLLAVWLPRNFSQVKKSCSVQVVSYLLEFKKKKRERERFNLSVIQESRHCLVRSFHSESHINPSSKFW